MVYQESAEQQEITACEIKRWLEREFGSNVESIQQRGDSFNEMSKTLFPVWGFEDLNALLAEYNRLSLEATRAECRKGLI